MNRVVPINEESELFDRLQLAASEAPEHLTPEEVDRLLGIPEQQGSR
jgi:hypothetical protein